MLQQAQATQKFISQRAAGNAASGMLKITTQFRLDAQRLETLVRSFGELQPDAEALMREVHETINSH